MPDTATPAARVVENRCRLCGSTWEGPAGDGVCANCR